MTAMLGYTVLQQRYWRRQRGNVISLQCQLLHLGTIIFAWRVLRPGLLSLTVIPG